MGGEVIIIYRSVQLGIFAWLLVRVGVYDGNLDARKSYFHRFLLQLTCCHCCSFVFLYTVHWPAFLAKKPNAA